MDERTLTALEGSIKKWEAIVAGTGEDYGSKNCPLCEEFIEEDDDDPDANDGCFGCPVVAKVHDTGCGGTPYVKWSSVITAANRTENQFFPSYPWKATTPELVALAQAELDFLKSLRPQATV